MTCPISIAMDDNKRCTTSAYRKYLYKMVIDKKAEIKARKAATAAGVVEKKLLASGGSKVDVGSPATATPASPAGELQPIRCLQLSRVSDCLQASR